ncbi:hypothetical protein ACRAQ6_02975 [Erythrobacter sp. HA6-11]
MILRRITRHVREQNWTAIAIDFVIVVTGVFLGIQIGNWTAGRLEQANFERVLPPALRAKGGTVPGGEGARLESSLQRLRGIAGSTRPSRF